VPTGEYGTIFGDNRTRTTDELSLASVSFDRALSNGASVSTRLHAGRYWYLGRVPVYGSSSESGLGSGRMVGRGRRRSPQIGSRQFLTFGAGIPGQLQAGTNELRSRAIRALHRRARAGPSDGALSRRTKSSSPTPSCFMPARGSITTTVSAMPPARASLDLHSEPNDHIQGSSRPRFRAPNEFELHYEALGYKVESPA